MAVELEYGLVALCNQGGSLPPTCYVSPWCRLQVIGRISSVDLELKVIKPIDAPNSQHYGLVLT